ncbi:hypothetical protein EV715DRAFT_213478 [Schizophyllum commune]
MDEASLLDLHRRIATQLDLHTLLVTPVHRLPPELLSEVFLYYRDALVRDNNALDVLFRLENNIVRVCPSWRAAAYGTPHLWTRLTVPRAKMFLDSYVHRFLPLSGNLPLILDSRSADGVLQPFLHLLRPHAFRWESARLAGDWDDFNSIEPVDAPLLRRMELHLLKDVEVPLEFLSSAPQLRELRLRMPSMFSARSLAPASALTFLRIHVQSALLPNIRSVLLESADTLEDLQVSVFNGFLGNDAPDMMPIELRQLKRLRFVYKTCTLLDHIHAPGIVELSLGGPNKKMPRTLLQYLERVAPIATNLRHLELLGRDIMRDSQSSQDLKRCFARMSTLEELSFAYPPPLAVLDMLLVRDDARPLIPNLRDADFQTTTETADAYMTFRKSRAEERMVRGVKVAVLNHTAADDPRECLRVFSKQMLTL